MGGFLSCGVLRTNRIGGSSFPSSFTSLHFNTPYIHYGYIDFLTDERTKGTIPPQKSPRAPPSLCLVPCQLMTAVSGWALWRLFQSCTPLLETHQYIDVPYVSGSHRETPWDPFGELNARRTTLPSFSRPRLSPSLPPSSESAPALSLSQVVQDPSERGISWRSHRHWRMVAYFIAGKGRVGGDGRAAGRTRRRYPVQPSGPLCLILCAFLQGSPLHFALSNAHATSRTRPGLYSSQGCH